MFTPEDEIDELERELERTRRLWFYKERAGFDHRLCDYITWSDSLGATRARVHVLEGQLAEARAALGVLS